MEDKDELKSCEAYGNAYTIKTYQREDCKFYAILIYETDDDSKIVYTSKAQNDEPKAFALAMERARKHEREMKK